MQSPSLHEAEMAVRASLPEHRLYDWRSVETMREQVARFGLVASRAQAMQFHIDRAQALIVEAQEQARAIKEYGIADKLRDAVQILTRHNG